MFSNVTEDNWEKSFKQLFLSFVIIVISTPSKVYNYRNITDITQFTFSSLKKALFVCYSITQQFIQLIELPSFLLYVHVQTYSSLTGTHLFLNLTGKVASVPTSSKILSFPFKEYRRLLRVAVFNVQKHFLSIRVKECSISGY